MGKVQRVALLVMVAAMAAGVGVVSHGASVDELGLPGPVTVETAGAARANLVGSVTSSRFATTAGHLAASLTAQIGNRGPDLLPTAGVRRGGYQLTFSVPVGSGARLLSDDLAFGCNDSATSCTIMRLGGLEVDQRDVVPIVVVDVPVNGVRVRWKVEVPPGATAVDPVRDNNSGSFLAFG